jgi:hypothetical protein
MGSEGDAKTFKVDEQHRIILTVKARNAWGTRIEYVEIEYQENSTECWTRVN